MIPTASDFGSGGIAPPGAVVWSTSRKPIVNRGIAVGTPITERAPHRSGRAQLRHQAPTSGV